MKITAYREGKVVKGTYEDFPERWRGNFPLVAPIVEVDGFKVCSVCVTELGDDVLFLSGDCGESSGEFSRAFGNEEAAESVLKKISRCVDLLHDREKTGADSLAIILKEHQLWLESDGAKGARADLTGADLTGANLTGADLDFSSLPLWCGSLNIAIDRRLAAQIAYHFCSLRCDDPEVVKLQMLLYTFANEFHRVQSSECPKLGQDHV